MNMSKSLLLKNSVCRGWMGGQGDSMKVEKCPGKHHKKGGGRRTEDGNLTLPWNISQRMPYTCHNG